eukprot:GHVT01096640.1.p1 GENE.GHVT01096640.1~~GHVT01096640.1.p1  ORF type:complete len:483 (-),score=70.29 GHVT01096640.1:1559-3007(-)
MDPPGREPPADGPDNLKEVHSSEQHAAILASQNVTRSTGYQALPSETFSAFPPSSTSDLPSRLQSQLIPRGLNYSDPQMSVGSRSSVSSSAATSPNLTRPADLTFVNSSMQSVNSECRGTSSRSASSVSRERATSSSDNVVPSREHLHDNVHLQPRTAGETASTSCPGAAASASASCSVILNSPASAFAASVFSDASSQPPPAHPLSSTSADSSSAAPAQRATTGSLCYCFACDRRTVGRRASSDIHELTCDACGTVGFMEELLSSPSSDVEGPPTSTSPPEPNVADPVAGLPQFQNIVGTIMNAFSRQMAGATADGNGEGMFMQIGQPEVGDAFFLQLQQIIPSMGEDAMMDRIIMQIMENDVNRYGTPPAASAIIAALRREKISSEEARVAGPCAICRDGYREGDEVHRLTNDESACSHVFHCECIVPWLKEHNSCPVCRFELPTDDPQYNRLRVPGWSEVDPTPAGISDTSLTGEAAPE